MYCIMGPSWAVGHWSHSTFTSFPAVADQVSIETSVFSVDRAPQAVSLEVSTGNPTQSAYSPEHKHNTHLALSQSSAFEQCLFAWLRDPKKDQTLVDSGRRQSS